MDEFGKAPEKNEGEPFGEEGTLCAPPARVKAPAETLAALTEELKRCVESDIWFEVTPADAAVLLEALTKP